MKYLGKINDPKDLVTKEYVDSVSERMSYVSFNFSSDGDLLLHNSELLSTSNFALTESGNLEVTI